MIIKLLNIVVTICESFSEVVTDKFTSFLEFHQGWERRLWS